MTASAYQDILDVAVRILLFEDQSITIVFTPGEGSIRLPTTRRLAEYLGIPHYYVLPRFAAMERDGLIRRVERVGISTTPAGTKAIVSLLEERYPGVADALLPEGVFSALKRLAGTNGSNDRIPRE
ncbi:hypothetical protein ASZ90_008872 [hydrocarbon metagenome]|uniref:Uncharacterized protein n=1 Tax=hydrocarbon metagenome TaxID=938273 RepID=A0A0W8FM43_9ZZZZ|nr:hypothetical protein [Methanomicrobiaceae archaeon]